MKNRSPLLSQLGLLDEDMWPNRKRCGVPPCELVLLAYKKIKELRLLLTLESLRTLHHHSLQRLRFLHLS